MAKKEWSEDELRSRAARYCVVAERCESEVREKLYQWGAAADTADRIIDYLTEERFVDEARYALAFTKDKLRYQGWGRVKIKSMLMAKRISSANVANALDSIGEYEYSSILSRLLERKRKEVTKKRASEIQLARFLLQRGFTWDEIRGAIKGDLPDESPEVDSINVE